MAAGNLRIDKPFDAITARIIYREPGGEWVDAPMRNVRRTTSELDPHTGILNETVTQGGIAGFELVSVQQGALPATNQAVIQFYQGHIYDSKGLTKFSAKDLEGWEVFIAGQRPAVDERPEENDGWIGLFWGVVEYQQDSLAAGSETAEEGVRTYTITDMASQLRNKQLNRHGYIVERVSESISLQLDNIRNNPGYNSVMNAQIIGNRYDDSGVRYENNGAMVRYHTNPGAFHGTQWSDLLAVEHAIRSTVGSDQLEFLIDDKAGALERANVWTISTGETVWTFINRVFARTRGLGQAVFEWTDDARDLDVEGGLPIEPTLPTLALYPATLDDIEYPLVNAGGTVTLFGATTAGTARSFSLINFPMAGPGFEVNSRATNTVDYLETYGEPIEVTTMVSYTNESLEQGWSVTDEVDFNNAVDKTLQRFRLVYQLHRIPRDWDGTTGNGTASGGTESNISVGTTGENAALIAEPFNPGLLRLAPTLPLFTDIDYEQAPPARYDTADEDIQSQHIPLKAFINSGASTEDDEWVDVDTIDILGKKLGPTVSVFIGNQQGETRTIGSPEDAGSVYNFDRLALTVNFHMPSPVMCSSGDPNGNRRMRVYQKGLKLQLVDRQAIWSLGDLSSAFRVANGLYNESPIDGNTEFSVQRDDRDALIQRHAMMKEWYLKPRQNVSFTIQADCMLMRTYPSVPDGEPVLAAPIELIEYPRVGEILAELSAAAQVYTPGTPITQITYDHQNAQSTLVSDWAQLDFF